MPFYVGGAAGMRNMGTYAAGTTYFPNDIVLYSGSSYIAKLTTTGVLPTNTTNWGVLASKGDAGAAGAAGVSGVTPRMTSTFTTSGAVAGTNYTGTITLATGYRLLALQTSAAARVRLYTDVAARNTDLARSVTTAEPDNSGLVLDYVTVNTTLQKLAPHLRLTPWSPRRLRPSRSR